MAILAALVEVLLALVAGRNLVLGKPRAAFEALLKKLPVSAPVQ